MPHALRIATSRVALEARGAYLAELRARRDRLAALGCRFWVFEAIDAAGAFTEFTEARDADTLDRALDAAGEDGDRASLLTEVELS